MSERSHTPGPWKISSWTGNITTADGLHVAGLDIESTRFPDAKLMAAAPEMLEALESIRAQLILEYSPYVYQVNFNYIDEAIQKATNER
jgi:hypothetical protein